jgi:hypothetical protein
MSKQEWTIQRHWQPSVHKTQDEEKQVNVRENRGGNQECDVYFITLNDIHLIMYAN